MKYYNKQEILEQKIKLLYRIMMIYNYDDILDAIILVDKELNIQIFIEEELYQVYNEEFIEFKENYNNNLYCDYDCYKDEDEDEDSMIDYYYPHIIQYNGNFCKFFIINIFNYSNNDYYDFTNYEEYNDKQIFYDKIKTIFNFIYDINHKLKILDCIKKYKEDGYSDFFIELFKQSELNHFEIDFLSNDLYKKLKEYYKNITISDINHIDESSFYSKYYYNFLYRYNKELKIIDEKNKLSYIIETKNKEKRKNKI